MTDNSTQSKSHLFNDVIFKPLLEDGSIKEQKTGCAVEILSSGQSRYVRVTANGEVIVHTELTKKTGAFKLGKLGYIINISPQPIIVLLKDDKDFNAFVKLMNDIQGVDDQSSVFTERTEETSAMQYFQFYGYLSQQQNMMQDYVRTSTYQRAILQNLNDFKDKVILDVGAGTGILSFFALQAGAKRVYAVEASNMAPYAQMLVKQNRMNDVIKVIYGKIEEIELPEQVDAIISEPMGYMLFNERMLETYLHAKKWLRPGGKMFPTKGDLHIAPFTDEALFMEHFGKANFWCQTSFYGADLTSLRQEAIQEYFRQPVVDTFDVRILMAKPCTHTVNFLTADEKDLHRIHVPLNYTSLMTATLHGLAFWFDVGFLGSSSHVWLSTAPQEPLTHWYQVRCLLPNPVFVRAGQHLSGHVTLIANSRQSYDVEMEISLDGTGVKSTNTLDLKNPYFRYTGVQSSPPPGNHNSSPTEQYWGNSGAVLNGGVLGSNNTTGQYGQSGNQAAGQLGQGALCAYSSQTIGNVMATGAGVPLVETGRMFINDTNKGIVHVEHPVVELN